MIDKLKQYPKHGQGTNSSGPNALPSRQIPTGVSPSHKTKYLNNGIEIKSNNLLDRNKAGSLEFTQNSTSVQPLLIEPITEISKLY